MVDLRLRASAIQWDVRPDIAQQTPRQILADEHVEQAKDAGYDRRQGGGRRCRLDILQALAQSLAPLARGRARAYRAKEAELCAGQVQRAADENPEAR